ncbi:MAG: Uma2 family endonuclease, partial [Planctomycetaceae bacterium]
VRGPDVWFITYDRLPKGPVDYDSYIDVAPEIVFEVVSPSDRWSEVSKKIAEYLGVGVLTVCVLEPETETLQLFLADNTSSTLSGDDELTFSDLLPEFAVPVRRFFE